jgi:Putative transposase
MTLAPEEFIRRFLIHVLPAGFHRIRHYGLLASSQRQKNIARARQLLNVPPPQPQPAAAENLPPADLKASLRPCPCCGARMFVTEVFARGRTPRYLATAPLRDMRTDTS